MIILDPVHTAVWKLRGGGTPLATEVETQVSVEGR
jgi:hypothetical protein